MSVTFTANIETIAGHTISCDCRRVQSGLFGDYADAIEAFKAGVATYGSIAKMLGCTDDYCAATELGAINVQDVAGEAPSFNMSNSNGAEFLTLLGIGTQDGLCGEETVTSMQGRIMLAQSLSPASVARPSVTRGAWTEGGRRSGYMEGRLDDLSEVVLWCQQHDRAVIWG